MSETLKDYYALFGVLPSIAQAALSAVYRALIKRYHPDVYSGGREDAERISRDLNEAYQMLGDSARRADYDRKRAASGEFSGDYQQAGRSDSRTRDEAGDVTKDWEFVVRYYPAVESQRVRLVQLSSALGFSFQIAVLESRVFDNPQKTANGMIAEYLRQYFGSHETVQKFVLRAVQAGRKDVALEVNRAIRALGTPKRHQVENFLERIRSHCDWVENFNIPPPINRYDGDRATNTETNAAKTADTTGAQDVDDAVDSKVRWFLFGLAILGISVIAAIMGK
jgi:hypothetical protein